MFVRKKSNRSGSISVVIIDKRAGKAHYLKTIGISACPKEIDELSYNNPKPKITVFIIGIVKNLILKAKRQKKLLILNNKIIFTKY